MDWKPVWMLVVVVMIMALLGCENKPTAKVPSSSKTQKYLYLKVGTNFFSKRLDPHLDYDGWYVMRYGVGETLVRMSDQMVPQPWLAIEWEYVDERTWNVLY